VIAQHIARGGKGLNLAFETLEGILNHARGGGPLTIDLTKSDGYSVVMFSDKISYTFADINDSIRYGYLDESSIPIAARELRKNQMERTFKCVESLIKESAEKRRVSFSKGKIFDMFRETRDSMFKNVYSKIQREIQMKILEKTFDFLHEPSFDGYDPVVLLSLLTDPEVNLIGEMFVKTKRPTLERLQDYGINELIPDLKGKKIDYNDPGLDWAK